MRLYGLRNKTLPFVRRSPFNDSRMKCELQVDESAQLTMGVIIKTHGGKRTKSGRRRRSVQNSHWRHRFHTEDGKKQALYFATRSIFPNLCSFDVASNHEESAEQTPCLPLEHQQQQVTARFFVSFRTQMFLKKNVAKINMNKH